jgi:hypothetical protein
MSTKKTQVEEKRIKTFNVSFTKTQIIHLRDLFSIVFADGTTASQSLARHEGRTTSEVELWKKIAKVCKTAKVAVGDEAPDFVIGISEPPVMSVFGISANDYEEQK